MTTKQENRFSMYLLLQDYLASYKAITDAIPGFKANSDKFGLIVSIIEENRIMQEGDKSGVALDKKSLKLQLISAILKISNKLVGLAVNTKNASLESEVSYTESKLKNTPDTTLRDIANLVYKHATDQLAALAPYGVTQKTLDDFKLLIDDYRGVLSKPKLSQNDRKTATENITQGFKDGDALLETMDKLAKIAADSQVEFYGGYVKSRKVVEFGSNTLSLRGKIKDTAGALLGNVNVEIHTAGDNALAKIQGGDQAPTVQKKSTDKGNFQIDSLAPGSYVAKITKPGYADQYINFTVVQGELTSLVVVLEKG